MAFSPEEEPMKRYLFDLCAQFTCSHQTGDRRSSELETRGQVMEVRVDC